MNHLFESFNLSKEAGAVISLERCRLCKAVKISIIEYGKDAIENDDVYLRGSKYCRSKRF